MRLDRFINRPVLSTVISVFIVIFGLLGLVSLPIEQYPDIAPPTIRVSTTYTGANAQAVLNSVIQPLEEQINGAENMDYMVSSASNNGSASIEVYFKQGMDPDMAGRADPCGQGGGFPSRRGQPGRCRDAEAPEFHAHGVGSV